MTKVFTLTVVKQVLRKKTIVFSKTQILYVSGNPNVSVALYGWKTFKLETEHKRQDGNYQIAKCKRKRSISDLGE